MSTLVLSHVCIDDPSEVKAPMFIVDTDPSGGFRDSIVAGANWYGPSVAGSEESVQRYKEDPALSLPSQTLGL